MSAGHVFVFLSYLTSRTQVGSQVTMKLMELPTGEKGDGDSDMSENSGSD